MGQDGGETTVKACQAKVGIGTKGDVGWGKDD
jgi:hypothetical protein